MTAEASLTPTDLRLLLALRETPNVVLAARRVRIPRDRAVYRLRRLARLYRRPVVRSRRGGREPGGTRLTAFGDRLITSWRVASPSENRWWGTYDRGKPGIFALDGGGTLEVTFRARPGSRVAVGIDPEAFVLALRPVTLSARNRLLTVVEDVRRRKNGTALVVARWGPQPVRVAVTQRSVDRLRLVRGRRVYCYLKATAVRRLPTPESPRS